MTVGMAMNNAFELLRHYKADLNPDMPEFWMKMQAWASSTIRLSNSLEHGKLAAPMSQPKPQGGRADPPKGERPLPGLDGAVALSEDEESVPF